MQLQSFVKSFSNGQITIPKKFREKLGIGNDFWLKLSLDQNRIIAEPQETKPNRKKYAETLLKLKTNWFDYKEWKEMRKKTNENLNRHLSNY